MASSSSLWCAATSKTSFQLILRKSSSFSSPRPLPRHRSATRNFTSAITRRHYVSESRSMSVLLRQHRSNKPIPIISSISKSNRRWIGGIGGGDISRMLDMGGAPSAANDKSLIRAKDASKNSPLQVVAFDFDILTRSLEDAKADEQQQQKESSSNKTTTTTSANKLSSTSSSIKPNIHQVQEIASLLNVPLDSKEDKPSSEKTPSPSSTSKKITNIPGMDIRAKYASKLKGGLPGVELAKSQVEETLKRGDAAGHLAARKMTIQKTAASPTKWMALSGTGKLLSYLTHRSIKIALLPNPRLKDGNYNKDHNNLNNNGENDIVDRPENEFKYMTAFSRQLKEIVVDSVVPYQGPNTDSLEDSLKTHVIDKLNVEPHKILLVSDKDEYLMAAKSLNMITCRLRPKNARRGNITAHYNSIDVPSVQEVVNEITGISFNAVLNR